jgi:hypothetical protein
MHGSLLSHIESLALPALYSQENNKDPIVYLKLELLNSTWQWLATEVSIEENDMLFFGYAVGFEKEWGYFRLSDLRSAGPLIYDCEFEPRPFSEVKKNLEF